MIDTGTDTDVLIAGAGPMIETTGFLTKVLGTPNKLRRSSAKRSFPWCRAWLRSSTSSCNASLNSELLIRKPDY
jgi:hypothetical protein